MQKFNQPWLLVVVLVIVVAGAFVGLAAAHDSGGDSNHEECEMRHDDCPMMDGHGMMGGMMQMSDDCPMDDREKMMGMHGTQDHDSAHDHDDCPMH